MIDTSGTLDLRTKSKNLEEKCKRRTNFDVESLMADIVPSDKKDKKTSYVRNSSRESDTSNHSPEISSAVSYSFYNL